MELLLIRHGLPERVIGEAPVDPPLTAEGQAQAAALAAWLDRAAPDALLSSPMARARETARPLADRFGLELKVDDDLAEFDRGAAAYIPIEEIKGTDHPHWKQLIDDWVGPAGEAKRRAFQTTVVAAVEGAVRDRLGSASRLAIVCHGGVINAYLSNLLGLDRMLFFEPAYTSVSRVRVSSGGRAQLQSLNEASHLTHAM